MSFDDVRTVAGVNFITQVLTREKSFSYCHFRIKVGLVTDWKVYEAEQSAQFGVASITAKQNVEVFKLLCSIFRSLMPPWIWKDGSTVVEQVTVGMSEGYTFPLNTSNGM